MKAVRFHDYGDPDVLRYEDVDQPVPGAGEIRIRVAATSFNSVDGNIRGGFMRGPIPVALPHTPGLDVAGTVDALGDGVSGFAVGDHVIGFLPMNENGAAAEYVVAPAAVLTAAPRSVPLVDSAALPVVGLTAYQALFDHGTLTAGQRVLTTARAERSAATPCSWPRTPAPTSSRRPARAATPQSRPQAPTRSSTTPSPA